MAVDSDTNAPVDTDIPEPPSGGGVTDHGALTGLADDDHPQYALDTDLTTHAALTTAHGITAAAATVLDNATVAAMVDTLGGAASTGTGGLVRANSPALVTPALGTPSALVLTNATGLPIAGGGTGQTTAQAAIDALTAVSGATNEHVLTKDTATGNAVFKAAAGGTRNKVYTFFAAGKLSTNMFAEQIRVYVDETCTPLRVELYAATAPTGAAIIVDVNENGTTLFSTQSNRPQIAAAANSGNTTTFNDTTITAGNYISIDIDGVGSTTPGENLTVTLVCRVN